MFVGCVPLLERGCRACGQAEWQPRPLFDLNRDLSKTYRLPIEIGAKASCLAAICRALNRGDLLHAQIATVHLEIPDPPDLTKSRQSVGEIVDLARQLQASGLLKADWDPAKHPRWPAGSPDSIGGRFAPAGTASNEATADESRPSATPAQLTIPVPFELCQAFHSPLKSCLPR